MEIEFNWPITALVGPNGTNKTSILHALAASPEGSSIAEYWFSTQLDNIDRWGGGSEEDQRKNPHRFIYKYRNPEIESEAECRKARVRKRFRGKDIPESYKGRQDPDYWEPTKATISDGMSRFDPDPQNPYKRKERWALIDKEIVFLDLKAEISAFDKFLRHSRVDRFTDSSTKKRIRAMNTAAKIERALSGTTKNKQITSKIIERPRDLDERAVDAVSNILGKKIASIRVIRHKLFGAPGTTFRLHLNAEGIEYSEAHAGSGEFAIIRLVDEIFRANPNALILLDEPEISLHPGAQQRFMEFLVDQTKSKKLQVVLSTHSPVVVDCLPARAIKVLAFDSSVSQVKLLAQSCTPSEAFNALGFAPKNNTRFRIIVEDELAMEIVEASMRRRRASFKDVVDVCISPGGADSIVKTVLPVLANGRDSFGESAVILLDGDQKKEGFKDFLELSKEELKKKLEAKQNRNKEQGEHESEQKRGSEEIRFETIWKECVHKTLPVSFKHSDGSNRKEIEEPLLEFAESRLGFLGDVCPEALLMRHVFPDDYDETAKQLEPGDKSGDVWKKWWEGKTRDFNRLTQQEVADSQRILETQKNFLNGLDDDSPLFELVMREVERISEGLN